jgi:hypothetical protein
MYCSNLKTIIIPEGVTSISYDAFSYCKALESVSLPSSITSIQSGAFGYCEKLSSVTIYKETPVYISDYSTFQYRSNATLYVPYGCKAAYEVASYWKDFKEIIELPVPAGTETTPFTCTEANALVAGLSADTPTETEYYVKGKISTIQNNFSYQYGNATFYISDDGTKNGEFYVYRTLYFDKQNYDGGRVPNLGDEVVLCGKLTNYKGITPETVNKDCRLVSINGKTIGTGLEVGDLFVAKTPEDVEMFFVVDNTGKSMGKASEIGCSVGYAAANRPETYTNPLCCINANYTGVITIPATAEGFPIQAIAPSAFTNAKLTSVNIPATVWDIETNAFKDCYNLASVTLPEGVILNNGTFQNCTALTSIELPKDVQLWASEAIFGGCTNLTAITVNDETPYEMHDQCLVDDPSKVTLYVPIDSKSAYEAAEYWKDFNIVEMSVLSSAIPESTIIPWGTEQAWEMKYAYFDEIGKEPGADGAGHAWTDAEFDDSSWKTLTGPIARYESDFTVVNTIWEKENSCYYLRRTFNLDEVNEQGYYFCSRHDDNIKVWINGTQVVDAGFNGRCQNHHIPASAFVKGTNTMAIYLDDTGGGANLDYCMANFYFLKNVETGKYLNADDEWRAVLADEGLPVKLYKQADGSYTIYFPFGSQNNQLLYRTGERVYVDYSKDWAQSEACPSWTFTDAGEGHIYIQSLATHPTYGQEAMPGTYMANNPSANYVDGNITAGNNITWTVEALPARTDTQTARLQELVTTAKALRLDTNGEEAVLNNSETTYIEMLETIFELQNRINDERNNINAKVQDLNKLIACAAAIGISTSDAQAVADNPQNMESVNNAMSNLRTTYIAKLGEGVDASLLPLDVTGAIINPTFATNEADGWSWKEGEDGPGLGSSTAEYRERTFDFHQTVNGLPNGSYLLKVKGFHRPGNKDDVFVDYMQGTDNAKAKFYANGNSVTLMNAAAKAQEHEVDGWSGIDVTYNGQTRYIPHENYDANTWFMAGYYENELSFTVTDGTLTFGISLDESVKDDWVCFDDFRLTYLGTGEVEPTDISTLTNAIYANAAIGAKGSTTNLTINLKNAQATNAYSFDLKLPEGVTVDSYTLSDRHNGHSNDMNYNETTGVYSFAVLSIQSKEVKGNDGTIMTLKLNVADEVALGDYAVKIQNAKYSLTDGSEKVSMPETISKLSIENYVKGDVNGDGDVDIADAVCIVNYVVGKPNTTFIEAAADANGDGDIDIADAVHIVNYVVGKISTLAPRFEWNLPEPE